MSPTLELFSKARIFSDSQMLRDGDMAENQGLVNLLVTGNKTNEGTFLRRPVVVVGDMDKTPVDSPVCVLHMSWAPPLLVEMLLVHETLKTGCWNDSTAGWAFALHMANPVQSSASHIVLHTLIGVSLEYSCM